MSQTTRQAPRPAVLVKTCRTKTVLAGLVCLAIAAGLAVRVSLGLPQGPDVILSPLGAAFMAGFALYLFALAIFRPIALRMDADGISGYYIPPMRWHEIGEIAPYKERAGLSLFYTMHVGIKVANTKRLFTALSWGKYNRALRLQKSTGFHILIPQLMLKDMNARSVVTAAHGFQTDAARGA